MRGSQNFPRGANGRLDQSAPAGSSQRPGGPISREREARPEAPVLGSVVVNKNVPVVDDGSTAAALRPAVGKG